MTDQDFLTYVHRIQHVPTEVDAGSQSQPWEDFLAGLAEYGLAIDSTGRLHLQGQNRFRYFNSIAVAGTSASQTGLAANTWNTVNFGAETIDTDGIHSTSSATSRLTFPLVGKWLVGGTALIDYTSIVSEALAGLRIIFNGGTTTTYGKNLSAVTNAATTTVVSTGLALVVATATTDFVELQGIVTDNAGPGTFDITNSTDNQIVAFYIGE